MRYHNSDFWSENLMLRRAPKNATEAYNKLVCLMEHEQRRDPAANRFYVRPLSKRRERLIKTFCAFRRMERMA